MSHPLIQLLNDEMARLPAAGLAVGYSGGLDSTALLHALSQVPAARARGLRALHVDHGLHPQSSNWSARCAAQARAWSVELTSVQVTVKASEGGLEAAARAARYAAFACHLREHEYLVLAHHRDDQVETLLLRLLRQSGSESAAGMRRLRALAGLHQVWRPLLPLPRSTLLDYALRHGLEWLDDPANASLAFDRNVLRHRVLPVMRERWPQTDVSLAGSAALLASEAATLAQLTARQLARCRSLDRRVLLLGALRRLDDSGRIRVLRAWLDERGLARPPLALHARLHDQIIDRHGSNAELAWGGVRLIRYRGCLYADAGGTSQIINTTRWDASSPLLLADGSYLGLDPAATVDPGWTVGPRHGGERLQLPGRTHSSSLKHALQELGVPPWERECLPLLWSSTGELLAAGDVLLSDALDRWLRAHDSRLFRTPSNESAAQSTDEWSLSG